jgi:hypothetical protein
MRWRIASCISIAARVSRMPRERASRALREAAHRGRFCPASAKRWRRFANRVYATMKSALCQRKRKILGVG